MTETLHARVLVTELKNILLNATDENVNVREFFLAFLQRVPTNAHIRGSAEELLALHDLVKEDARRLGVETHFLVQQFIALIRAASDGRMAGSGYARWEM